MQMFSVNNETLSKIKSIMICFNLPQRILITKAFTFIISDDVWVWCAGVWFFLLSQCLDITVKLNPSLRIIEGINQKTAHFALQHLISFNYKAEIIQSAVALLHAFFFPCHCLMSFSFVIFLVGFIQTLFLLQCRVREVSALEYAWSPSAELSAGPMKCTSLSEF